MKKIIYIPLIICTIIYILFANGNWNLDPGEWPIEQLWIESLLWGIGIIVGIFFAKQNKL